MPNYTFVGVWILEGWGSLLLVNIPYYGPPRKTKRKGRYTETISLVNYTEDQPVSISERIHS